MTERDPVDAAAEALFEAARKEQPDGRVRARAKVLTRNALRGIRAANTRVPTRAEAPQYIALAGAALVVAAAAFVLVSLKQRPERERPITVTQEVIAPEKRLEQTPAAREPAENTRAVEALPKRQPANKRERRAAPTLAEEIALLDQARAALSERNSTRVLALVQQYERELAGTRMRAEAELLRIEALAQSGQRSEAAKLAERFIEQYAGNPLTDRARALATPNRATPEIPLEEQP